MDNIRQIAFGYSTRCNIKCEHCVAADDISQNVKMELARAHDLIEEMALYNVTGISFTAGEPLLYLNDIIELIRLCRACGIYSRVVTNAFWAKNQDDSDRIVSQLKQNGLSQLRISFSRWHQQHIDKNNIVSAALSCKKLDLNYFISFITDFSETDDPYEQILRENNLKFFPESLIYFGRAQKFNQKEILTDYQPNTCMMNPYLTPELDMFACCDAGYRFTKTNFFYLGNIKDQNIDALFKKKENNILYRYIRTVGLTSMASFLGVKASEIVKYRKCELCEKLFNSPVNLSRMEQAAQNELAEWKR